MDGPENRDSGDELQRRITIQKEKTKLSAMALNNTVVTLFAGGFVLPIVALSFPLATAPPATPATGFVIGVWALVPAGYIVGQGRF